MKKKENFKKYFGVYQHDLLKKSEFCFSDFLGRILLYTVFGNVDNRVGEEYVKLITSDYIDNVTNPYLYEYQWNPDTQILTFTFISIFNIFNLFEKSISDYQIDYFIEKIDPTVQMNFNLIEKCESFIKDIEGKVSVSIELDPANESALILENIRQFTQTLDDYTEYLCINTRPIPYYIEDNLDGAVPSHKNKYTDIAVPLYRDEDMQWYQNFIKKVKNYREQLICIYQELLKLHNNKELGD